ncbi:MAG: nitrate- and nitrite sensing domain-containing protein [Roseobacter sp.]
MRRFLSLSVSKMLLILTASGFLVTLAFAGPQIVALIADRATIKVDVHLTRLTATIGHLTHELQKERGASAGFISSNGAKFGDILPAQRIASDKAISDFEIAEEAVEHEFDVNSPLIVQLREVRDHVANLSDLRKQIDNLDITTADAVGAITELNHSAIALLPELAKNLNHSEPAQAVQRHSILLAAKDSAGLERAVGTAGFAQAGAEGGVFSPETVGRFHDLIIQQKVLFEVYEKIASPELVEMMVALENGPTSTTVNNLRDIAQSNDAIDIAAVTPEFWFRSASELIDLIKEVEDAGEAEIINGTAEALAHSDASLMEILSLLAGLMIVVGFCAIFLVRQVVRSISLVSARVVALADGDIDSEIPDVAPSDLRRITKALGVFRDLELQTRDLKEQQSQLEFNSAAGIKRLAKTVSEGDFSSRLRMRDLQGASKVLGEGLNEIMGVVEEVANLQTERDREALEKQVAIAKAGEQAVEELKLVVSACVKGDFTQRLCLDDKEGVFADLCEGVNRIGEVTNGGLSELMGVLEALAVGDLSKRMSEEYEGVFLDIGRKINQTNEELSGIVNQISSASQNVQMSSSELSDAANDLAHRTEKSAASLEEASNSVDELTAAVKSTANSAEEVSHSTHATRSVVESTAREVEDMVTAMESIASSSSEISKITSVIDDISFQTNLLSLNAGVEAARAGQAGQGFAVVATEVRILAQRTAQAAMEINELISKSEAQVGAGVEMVGRSRASLNKIQTSIHSMADEVLQMVETAADQSAGIVEINKTITQIEQSTQQNAAMCEETNAVAQTMNQEAHTLVSAISSFSAEEKGSSDWSQGVEEFDTSELDDEKAVSQSF